MSHSHTYSPYGAYELKRSYRRNLGIATGIAIMLFSTVGIVTLTMLDVESPPPPRVDTIEQTFEFPNQVSIVAESGPEITIRPTGPPPTEREGAVPVPVDDDLIPDSARQPLLMEDWTAYPDGAGDTGDWHPGSGGPGGPGATSVGIPEYPPPDSFIPLEIQPQLIDYVTPNYPRLMIEAGIEGTVWVQALIDTDGRVLKAIVARSSGVELLDEAAVNASYENTFSPGVQNGVPVRVWVTYRVDFNLRDRRH